MFQTYFFTRFLVLCVSLSVTTILCLPLTVEATTTKQKSQARVKSVKVIRKRVAAAAPEKNIKNPTSRCLTASIRSLYARAQKQMELDIAKYGPGHEKEIKVYRSKIATSWAAMSEPYCGIGSRGVAAVKKSFIKSTDHIRAEFLKLVK